MVEVYTQLTSIPQFVNKLCLHETVLQALKQVVKYCSCKFVNKPLI